MHAAWKDRSKASLTFERVNNIIWRWDRATKKLQIKIEVYKLIEISGMNLNYSSSLDADPSILAFAREPLAVSTRQLSTHDWFESIKVSIRNDRGGRGVIWTPKLTAEAYMREQIEMKLLATVRPEINLQLRLSIFKNFAARVLDISTCHEISTCQAQA